MRISCSACVEAIRSLSRSDSAVKRLRMSSRSRSPRWNWPPNSGSPGVTLASPSRLLERHVDPAHVSHPVRIPGARIPGLLVAHGPVPVRVVEDHGPAQGLPQVIPLELADRRAGTLLPLDHPRGGPFLRVAPEPRHRDRRDSLERHPRALEQGREEHRLAALALAVLGRDKGEPAELAQGPGLHDLSIPADPEPGQVLVRPPGGCSPEPPEPEREAPQPPPSKHLPHPP